MTPKELWELYDQTRCDGVARWHHRDLPVEFDDFRQDCLVDALTHRDEYLSALGSFRTWFSWRARGVRRQVVAEIRKRLREQELTDPLRWEDFPELVMSLETQLAADYFARLRKSQRPIDREKYLLLSAMEDYIRTFSFAPKQSRIAELLGWPPARVAYLMRLIRTELKEAQ